MSTTPPPPPGQPPNPYKTPVAAGRPPMPAHLPSAVDEVSGPATGLMITAILGAMVQAVGLLVNIFGAGLATTMSQDAEEQMMQMLSGGIGIVSGIIALLLAGLILYAALQMKKLESWGLAMGGSILAMVPCLSPCCFVGLPVGIWCLVVLTKDHVKTAFR